MSWADGDLLKEADGLQLEIDNGRVINGFNQQRQAQQQADDAASTNLGQLANRLVSGWSGPAATTQAAAPTTAMGSRADSSDDGSGTLGQLADRLTSWWSGGPSNTTVAASSASGTPQAMPTTPPRQLSNGDSIGDISISQAGTRASRFAPQIAQVSREEGVPADVLAALIDTENSGEDSVSAAGARGVGQVVPGQGYDLPGEDASDPLTSIRQMARAAKDKYRIVGGDWDEVGPAYFGYGGSDATGMTTDRYRQIYQQNRAKYQSGQQPAPSAPAPGRVTPPPAEQTPAAQAQATSAYTQQGLADAGDPDAWAKCGPVAAFQFAQKMGRNPTPAEVEKLARDAGWTPEKGMAGFQSEAAVLKGMNIAAHAEDGVDWQKVIADVSRGNPVLLQLPGHEGHYITAQGYDPQTGRIDFGSTVGDLRAAGHRTQFTPAELDGLGWGTPNAALYVDNPATPAPSVVAGRSDPLREQVNAPVAGGGLVQKAEQPSNEVDQDSGDGYMNPIIRDPSVRAIGPLGPALRGGTIDVINDDAPFVGTNRNRPVYGGPIQEGPGTPPPDPSYRNRAVPGDRPEEMNTEDDRSDAATVPMSTQQQTPRPGTAQPIVNPDGSVTTERSITVTDPRLNGGRATNIPTVWDGRIVSDDRAIDNAARSGIQWPSYDSVDEAVSVAEQRSRDLGAGIKTSIGGAVVPPEVRENRPYRNRPVRGEPIDENGGTMYRQPLGPATQGPDTTPETSGQSTYNDPENGGTQTTPLPSQQPDITYQSGGEPTPAARAEAVGPFETRPMQAQQDDQQPQIAQQSMPDPPGWQSLYDSAGRFVRWVQTTAQDVGSTIANEGVVRPIARPISNAIRSAQGREPLTPDTEPVPTIDTAIQRTARSLQSNAGAVQSGLEQGGLAGYGEAGLGALGVAMDLAPSVTLARQLNEMLPKVDTPLGEIGAGDVVMTAALAKDLIQLGYGAAKVGGRVWSKIAQAAQEGVPAEQFGEWLGNAPSMRSGAQAAERGADDIAPGTQSSARQMDQGTLPSPSEPIARPNERAQADAQTPAQSSGDDRALSQESPPRQNNGGEPGALSQPAETSAASAPEQPPKHDYSSTQLNLPEPIAQGIRKFGETIPDSHLAEDGRETQIHLTTKYGLQTNDVEDVRQAVEGHGPITVTLGKTDVFPAGEAGGSDVVMVRADSPELRDLNARLSELPNGDTHPEYQPHITVAYVKPGKGKQYAGSRALAGQKVTVDSLAFSDRNGQQVEIPLTGKPGTAAAPEAGQRALTVPESAPTEAARPILTTEAQAIVNNLAGRFPGIDNPDVVNAIAGRPADEARRLLRSSWSEAGLPRDASVADYWDAVDEAMTVGEREARGRFFDPRMERRGYGQRQGGGHADLSQLAEPSDARYNVDPLSQERQPIPRTVDDAPRGGSISLNATPGVSRSASLVGDVANAAGGSVYGAAIGAGLPAENDDERRRHALEGAGLGLVAGPIAGRLMRRGEGGALATFGFGPQRPAAQSAARAANPVVRDVGRMMQGEYKIRKAPDPRTRMQRISDAWATAWTDNRAGLYRLQDAVSKAIGRELQPHEMVAELSRVNPASVASQRLTDNLRPALQRVGEDQDWLAQYLVHSHNTDVAREMGQRAYDKAITAGRSPAVASREAMQAANTRAFSGDLTLAETRKALTDIEASVRGFPDGAQRWQEIQDAAQAVWDHNKETLTRKRDSGLIPDALYNELVLRYPRYVRTDIADYFEKGTSGPAPAGRLIGTSDVGIQKLDPRGTGKDRVNPLLSTIDQTYTAESAIQRNEAGKAFEELVRLDPSWAQTFREVVPRQGVNVGNPATTVPVTYKLKSGEQFLNVWQGGKARSYVIPRELAPLVQPQGGTILGDNAAVNTWRAGMEIYKGLITSLRPGFSLVVSPIRDAGDYAIREATMSAEHGGIRGAGEAVAALPGVVADYVKAVPAAFSGILEGQYKGDLAAMMRAGAGQVSRPGHNDTDLRRALTELSRAGGMRVSNLSDLRSIAGNVLTLGAEPIGNRLEQVPRLAAARREAKAGGSRLDQAMAFRDATIDFQRGGNWSKAINAVIPFFNASMQGGAQVVRTARQNPAAFMAATAATIGAATAASEAWNNSDPQMSQDYADVPSYLRKTGIVFMLPGVAGSDQRGDRRPNFAWIPTGSYGALVGAARDALQKTNQGEGGPDLSTWGGWGALVGDVGGTFSPLRGDSAGAVLSSVTPPGLSTGIELAANKDLYRGSTIATDRGDENASALSQGSAAAFNRVTGQESRPSQWEYLYRDLGGYGADIATAGSNMAAEALGMRRPNGDSRPIQDMPIVGNVAGRVVRDNVGQQLETAQDERNRVPEGIRDILQEAGLRREELTPVPSTISQVPLTREEQSEAQRRMNDYVVDELLRAQDNPKWTTSPEKLARDAISRARQRATTEVLRGIPKDEQNNRKANQGS